MQKILLAAAMFSMTVIHDAIVDYKAAAASATATITYEDSEQSPGAIAQAITKLGYPATVKDAKQ